MPRFVKQSIPFDIMIYSINDLDTSIGMYARRLGRAEHYSNFHTDLVDEYHRTVRLRDDPGELA